jgi:hypothetical protein
LRLNRASRLKIRKNFSAVSSFTVYPQQKSSRMISAKIVPDHFTRNNFFTACAQFQKSVARPTIRGKVSLS